MRRVSIALAALATVAVSAHADVYKSIDAQGQARYSDQWSPGAELIKGDRLRSVPGTASDAPAPATNDRAAPAEPSKEEATKEVQAEVAAARAQQCTQLKEQYAKAIAARRIYQANSDPNAPKQFLSDADADAERVKLRQARDEACGGGASG